MPEQMMPNNPEAEQSVLGSLIIERNAVTSVMEELQETDFYRESHRQIFAAAYALYARGEPLDLITLVAELRRRQHLESAGGLSYLNQLAGIVPTTANLPSYIKELQDKATLRAMIMSAHKITNLSFTGEESARDILNTAEKEFLTIGNRRGGGATYSSIGNILFHTYEELETLMNRHASITGVSTGFYELDKFTAGFQNSDLLILAARPGVGKTTVMTNIMQHAAVSTKVPSVFFSLEMSKEQLAQRILCSESGVDLYKLRNGFLEDADWSKITKAIGPLSAAPIYIDDTPSLSVVEFRSRLRRMKAELGIGFVVIDYLQLMTLDSKPESRQQEISFISRTLKAIAKEINVPILVASQLNRGVEGRTDKRPMMSDLLESGGIEANADVVMFLYRDDYYNTTNSEDPNGAEIIIAKQRNGPTGTVNLFFLKTINRFVNKDKSQ
jgi:replicative DNA helicase